MLSETITYAPNQLIYIKEGRGALNENLLKLGMSGCIEDRNRSYRSDSNFSVPKTKFGDRFDEDFLKGFVQDVLGYKMYKVNRSTENFYLKDKSIFTCFDTHTLPDMYRMYFEKFLTSNECYFFYGCKDEILRRALIFYYDSETSQELKEKVRGDERVPQAIKIKCEYLFS